MRLLNYLEHIDVYNAYNFKLGDVLNGVAGGRRNTTVISTNIAGYLCPSDANPGNTGPWPAASRTPVTLHQLRHQRREQPAELGGPVNGDLLVAGRQRLLRRA